MEIKHANNKINGSQTSSDTEKSVRLFSQCGLVSAKGPDVTLNKSVSAPSVPVSARKKMVSVFQSFPVSKGFAQKSNKGGLFACCFLKISHCEEGVVPVRETTANIYIG